MPGDNGAAGTTEVTVLRVNTRAIASEVLAALESHRQITPFSERIPGFDLTMAYAVTAELRRLRETRGERPVGRKIGFTNQTIWIEYRVCAPIWGDMYDGTVHDLRRVQQPFALAPFAEPRIEPEIAFKLARTPEPGMDEAAILGCVEWISHGFEVVQSIFPGWRFTAADCVAGAGLHGAYLLGAPHAVDSARTSDWLHDLAQFQITLLRNGEPVDRGGGTNVLESPLSALRHLIVLLAEDRWNPPLAANEIITTGTLTRAFPITPGELWSTEISGLPVEWISVAFV